MGLFYEQLQLQDIVFVSVVISVFGVLSCFASRKTWHSAEIVFALMFGIGFLGLPTRMLAFQVNGDPNAWEVLVVRVYGGCFLGSGLIWYRTRETRDATVSITLITSRVVTSSILLMSQLVSYFAAPSSKLKVSKTSEAGSEKTDQDAASGWSNETFLLYSVLPTALWMLGSFIHVLRSHDFNFYPQHNVRLNNHLRIDAWFMFLFGTALLSFPGLIMKAEFVKSDAVSTVSLHILRSIGGIAVGEAVISLQAPGFLHPRDKQALFATRIVMILLQFVVLSAGCFWLKLISTNALVYTAALFSPVFLNAFVGLVSDGTIIYSVSTPKRPTTAKKDESSDISKKFE